MIDFDENYSRHRCSRLRTGHTAAASDLLSATTVRHTHLGHATVGKDLPSHNPAPQTAAADRPFRACRAEMIIQVWDSTPSAPCRIAHESQ